MKYNGVEFEAIVATPGCGKSYLCDRYPEKYVDVDELRLRCKYIVPENITRQELERTKGNRDFKRREGKKDAYLVLLKQKLVDALSEGKILICAPHPEVINILKQLGLKYCFVFPSKEMKDEIKQRMIDRGNSSQMIQENYSIADSLYEQNLKETDSAVKYLFGHGEYLEEILKKFQ